MNLLIAPCSHEAAKYAVMNWHYSRQMPISKLIKHGVWENDVFIGAIIYGRGANNRMLAPYGLNIEQGCELVRIALKKHQHPVSQIATESLKALKKTNSNLRLVVSYADPRQNHYGGIYQAMNWIYTGTSGQDKEYFYDGKWWHSRMLHPTGFGTIPPIARLTKNQQKALPTRTLPGKHRYLYPLDRAMRRQILPLSLPYPHAVEGSEASRSDSITEGQVQSLPTAPAGRHTM